MGTSFCAGPLAPKKEVGVEQEKVSRVAGIFGSAGFSPSNRIPWKNIIRFKARRTPFRLMLCYWFYF
jgi:hypothetical protein